MKFAYKIPPHIKAKSDTMTTMHIALAALLFVTAWAVMFQILYFGTDYAIQSLMVITAAVSSAFLTHILFHFFKTDGVKYKSFSQRLYSTLPKTWTGAPFITALMIALMLPAGVPLYAVIVATVFAEFFAKLVFGGLGNNIFNPAAVGVIIAGFMLHSMLGASAGAISSAGFAELAAGAGHNWRISTQQGLEFIDGYGGLFNIFFGSVRGGIGDTARFAVLIALVLLAWRKVIDWVVPLVFIGTVSAAAFLFGLYLGIGIFEIWYPILHIFSGALILCAVFMACDPVTTPINRQGRIIFAIFLAMVTVIIRLNANHAEAVPFAILIMNMFVPYIDRKTSNVTTLSAGAKIASMCGCFVFAVGFSVGLSVLLS